MQKVLEIIHSICQETDCFTENATLPNPSISTVHLALCLKYVLEVSVYHHVHDYITGYKAAL